MMQVAPQGRCRSSSYFPGVFPDQVPKRNAVWLPTSAKLCLDESTGIHCFLGVGMIRKGLQWAVMAFVFPLLCAYKVSLVWSTRDGSVEAYSQLLAALPGRFGVLVRAAFFSRVLSECDHTVFIGFGALLSKADTRLGKHVYIGPYCQLGWVSIGPDTLLGPGVHIPSGPKAHTFDRLDIPIRNQPSESRQILIGRDWWIGAASIVMADFGDRRHRCRKRRDQASRAQAACCRGPVQIDQAARPGLIDPARTPFASNPK